LLSWDNTKASNLTWLYFGRFSNNPIDSTLHSLLLRDVKVKRFNIGNIE